MYSHLYMHLLIASFISVAALLKSKQWDEWSTIHFGPFPSPKQLDEWICFSVTDICFIHLEIWHRSKAMRCESSLLPPCCFIHLIAFQSQAMRSIASIFVSLFALQVKAIKWIWNNLFEQDPFRIASAVRNNGMDKICHRHIFHLFFLYFCFDRPTGFSTLNPLIYIYIYVF
jgi:hypothetical protein